MECSTYRRKISDLVDGEVITREEEVEIKEHLESCENCSLFKAQIEKVDSLFSKKNSLPTRELNQYQKFFSHRNFLFAATLIIVVGTIKFYEHRLNSLTRDYENKITSLQQNEKLVLVSGSLKTIIDRGIIPEIQRVENRSEFGKLKKKLREKFLDKNWVKQFIKEHQSQQRLSKLCRLLEELLDKTE